MNKERENNFDTGLKKLSEYIYKKGVSSIDDVQNHISLEKINFGYTSTFWDALQYMKNLGRIKFDDSELVDNSIKIISPARIEDDKNRLLSLIPTETFVTRGEIKQIIKKNSLIFGSKQTQKEEKNINNILETFTQDYFLEKRKDDNGNITFRVQSEQERNKSIQLNEINNHLDKVLELGTRREIINLVNEKSKNIKK
ncbi:MAG: hypothetical protein ABIJ05_00365 [Patescibacteria group bacterium]